MYKSIYSYYGGKSKLAHQYPAPAYPVIIEPFAGAGSYALRYADRRVILCERDNRVAEIWRFLLSPDAVEWIERIPDTVLLGQRASELVENAPSGLVEILRAEANPGSQGARGVHEQVTKMGANCWHRLKPRLLYWLPRIRHWEFVQGDYRCLGNIEATWFIDPPYDNAAGKRYRESALDYQELAAWCLERRGQIIVCENVGATWLEFRPLVSRRGIRSSYQKSNAGEAVYVRE